VAHFRNTAHVGAGLAHLLLGLRPRQADEQTPSMITFLTSLLPFAVLAVLCAVVVGRLSRRQTNESRVEQLAPQAEDLEICDVQSPNGTHTYRVQVTPDQAPRDPPARKPDPLRNVQIQQLRRRRRVLSHPSRPIPGAGLIAAQADARAAALRRGHPQRALPSRRRDRTDLARHGNTPLARSGPGHRPKVERILARGSFRNTCAAESRSWLAAVV
jgi:hypothetical protein